jgi:hypothetical protein
MNMGYHGILYLDHEDGEEEGREWSKQRGFLFFWLAFKRDIHLGICPYSIFTFSVMFLGGVP